jgi:signal recognition particle GTPase
MTMKLWTSIFALVLVLGLVLAPAIAQKAKDGSASSAADDQMTRMMTMMEQMQDQMKSMQEQMGSMQGMGGMHGRMGRMTGMMGQMSDMMQQHRAEMEKFCPATPAPDRPKPGG